MSLRKDTLTANTRFESLSNILHIHIKKYSYNFRPMDSRLREFALSRRVRSISQTTRYQVLKRRKTKMAARMLSSFSRNFAVVARGLSTNNLNVRKDTLLIQFWCFLILSCAVFAVIFQILRAFSTTEPVQVSLSLL